MNKCLPGGLIAVLLVLASPLASARDNVQWSLNIGVPGVAYPAYTPTYQVPVYSQPQVIYEEPRAVYVNPPPAYYYPQQRGYVQPAPVYGPVYGPVYYNNYGAGPRYYGHRGHHDRHRGYGERYGR